MDINPYQVLGVSSDATPSQIKAAYRKLALQYHPDKLPPNSDPQAIKDANEAFATISHAYQLLTDPTPPAPESNDDNVSRTAHYSSPPYQQQQDNSSAFFFGSGGRRHRPGSSMFGFRDPFDLFRDIFGSDTNFDLSSSPSHPLGGSDFGGSGLMMDNMMTMMMGGGNRNRGMMTGGSLLDSFFGSPFGGGNRMDNFGRQPFSPMIDMFMPQHQHHSGGNSSSSFSYTTSSGIGKSTSTTTSIQNGKSVTKTETTFRRGDGRQETTIDLTEDDIDNNNPVAHTSLLQDNNSFGYSSNNIRDIAPPPMDSSFVENDRMSSTKSDYLGTNNNNSIHSGSSMNENAIDLEDIGGMTHVVGDIGRNANNFVVHSGSSTTEKRTREDEQSSSTVVGSKRFIQRRRVWKSHKFSNCERRKVTKRKFEAIASLESYFPRFKRQRLLDNGSTIPLILVEEEQELGTPDRLF